jgi:hypothetical protein
MTLDEALDVIEGICPCFDKCCPDSSPIRQYELDKARAVIDAEDQMVEAQIETHQMQRAFGDDW